MPGRDAQGRPLCVDCAGITTDLRCDRCGQEEEHYRKGICARCALRDDLTQLLGDGPTGTGLLEALCSATRPQSTLTWMRNPAVRKVLAEIGCLSRPVTHQDLDMLGQGRHVVPLRGVLEHHQLLPARDPDLARFEAWLRARLDSITEPAHRQVLQQFATWHHLRRL